jgi:hypothetical protein
MVAPMVGQAELLLVGVWSQAVDFALVHFVGVWL